MPDATQAVEYQTVVVGAAYLTQHLLERLGVGAAIDQELKYQPDIAATYGQLAQAIILNRMMLDPQPLYRLGEWAREHGIDRLLQIRAEWLDDDRLGAMLEGLADHQVAIWTRVLKQAIEQFAVPMEWLQADTTSIYFEGTYEDANGHPKRGGEGVPVLVQGYNKDGKPHKVQMVLSLITSQRVPVWYQGWDGNQNDDGVYLADMTALRQTGVTPQNTVLIGDRKLCNHEAMLGLCRMGQGFVGAHPWTEEAKAEGRETGEQLRTGALTWTPVDYTPRHAERKPVEERPQWQVCEVAHPLTDPETGTVYSLRWVLSWSSAKAEQDARQRTQAIQQGLEALERIRRLLGKYDYKSRKTIETRIETTLKSAKAQPYLTVTLTGTDADQGWGLTWEVRVKALTEAACFDGIVLLCTNVLETRLPVEDVLIRYKGQVYVEQTIDFLKSPVAIRPMWLHAPKRLAGLTLLILIAVLVAALLEHQVRRLIATTGQPLQGLMREGRDNPYPTAKKMLQAFGDYALVLVRHAEGCEEIHYPKLRSVQQQIWTMMGLPLVPV